MKKVSKKSLQSKKKHVTFAILGVMCFFGTLLILFWQSGTNNFSAKVQSGHCEDSRASFTVRGNSMSPRIEDSSEIEVEENYYECRGINPKHGDIIIIEDTAIEGPYIKTIGAIPGDSIELTENGTLLVNGAPLQNQSGDLYLFTPREQSFLSLYIRDEKLQNNAYFVFGENTKNSRDSRKIGALARSAIKGKVLSVNGTPLD